MDDFYLKAKMVNGNLVINNHDQVRSILKQLDGKDLILHVQLSNNKASNKQIRWYWGVAVQKIIQSHKARTGEFISKAEVHAFNIQEIVKPRLLHREIMGKTVIEIDNFSLSGMNKVEFSNFKNKLQEYWAKKDIDIPDPGETDFINELQDKAYDRLENFKGESSSED